MYALHTVWQVNFKEVGDGIVKTFYGKIFEDYSYQMFSRQMF